MKKHKIMAWMLAASLIFTGLPNVRPAMVWGGEATVQTELPGSQQEDSASNPEAGNAGAGNAGAADAGTGNVGAADTGAGSNNTENAGAGNGGTGNTETGSSGAGEAERGGGGGAPDQTIVGISGREETGDSSSKSTDAESSAGGISQRDDASSVGQAADTMGADPTSDTNGGKDTSGSGADGSESAAQGEGESSGEKFKTQVSAAGDSVPASTEDKAAVSGSEESQRSAEEQKTDTADDGQRNDADAGREAESNPDQSAEQETEDSAGEVKEQETEQESEEDSGAQELSLFPFSSGCSLRLSVEGEMLHVLAFPEEGYQMAELRVYAVPDLMSILIYQEGDCKAWPEIAPESTRESEDGAIIADFFPGEAKILAVTAYASKTASVRPGGPKKVGTIKAGDIDIISADTPATGYWRMSELPDTFLSNEGKVPEGHYGTYMKRVHVEVEINGETVKKTYLMYCLQSSLPTPGNITKATNLETNSRWEEYQELIKALYFLSTGDEDGDGALFGKTLTDSNGNSISLKKYYRSIGLTSEDAQYAMSHLVMAYLYYTTCPDSNEGWTWNELGTNGVPGIELSDYGIEQIKAVAEMIKSMEYPQVSLTPESTSATYVSGHQRSGTYTYQSYVENTLTLEVGAQVQVCDASSGAVLGSGSVAIPGGTSFYLESLTPLKGVSTYTGKPALLSGGNAYRRRGSSDQDIGFAVVTAQESLSLQVEWPSLGQITLQKTDRETGKTSPLTTALTFAGARYGLYDNAACTSGTEITVLTTDSQGKAATERSLPVKDYYLKELTAPEGYLPDSSVTRVTAAQIQQGIDRGDGIAAVTVSDQIIRGNLALTKIKTTHNMQTSAAAGVEFRLTYVKDPSIRFNVVQGKENTLITDADGFATTVSSAYPGGTLIYGDWQITEVNTPAGFSPISPTVITVKEDGRLLRYIANNTEIYASLLIRKIDRDTGNPIPVAGVRFSLYQNGAPVSLFDPATRSYQTAWTTDGSGQVQLPESIPVGTYELREDPASLPEGYYCMKQMPFSITQGNNDPLSPVVLDAKEPPQMGRILVKKEDIDTQAPLGGYVFEIRAAEDILDPSGAVRTMTGADGEQITLTKGALADVVTTGEDGTGLSRALYLGNYEVREIHAGEGYALEETQEGVFLAADPALAAAGEESQVSVLFQNHPTTLRVKKVDSVTGEPLEGVTLRVKEVGAEEDADQIFSTDAEGMICVTGLKHGASYEVTEVMPLPGYLKMNQAVTFQVDEEGQIEHSYLAELELQNIPIRLTVSKQDITGGSELPGAKLRLASAEGELIEEWVSSETPHLIHALSPGEYLLTEITAPEGYEVTETIRFQVEETGELQQVIMYDSPFREVDLSKTDLTGGEEIPGALLRITGEDGGLVEEWISGETPHRVRLPAGSYQLTEITAPAGYLTAETISFSVKKRGTQGDDEIQRVEMRDDVTKVEISKQSIVKGEGGKELPGAELIITDENGEEVAHWISEDTPHYIEKLPVGIYTLTEITAPAGYEVAESVTFTVEDSPQIQQVVMYDAPTPEPERAETPPKTGSPAPAANTSPHTSDSTPVGPLLLLMLGALLIILGCAGLRRKRFAFSRH